MCGFYMKVGNYNVDTEILIPATIVSSGNNFCEIDINGVDTIKVPSALAAFPVLSTVKEVNMKAFLTPEPGPKVEKLEKQIACLNEEIERLKYEGLQAEGRAQGLEIALKAVFNGKIK